MKKIQTFLFFLCLSFVVTGSTLSACSKDNEEDEYTEQLIDETNETGQTDTDSQQAKPSIYLVYSRVEKIQSTYTLEVVFGVYGTKDDDKVKVVFRYGNSKDNYNKYQDCSRMNYSSDRYMVRLGNRSKGSRIYYRGVLSVNGVEVSHTDGIAIIN